MDPSTEFSAKDGSSTPRNERSDPHPAASGSPAVMPRVLHGSYMDKKPKSLTVSLPFDFIRNFVFFRKSKMRTRALKCDPRSGVPCLGSPPSGDAFESINVNGDFIL